MSDEPQEGAPAAAETPTSAPANAGFNLADAALGTPPTEDGIPAPASGDEWLVNEGVPGTGEKPEWFNSKRFTSIYEQAKSQDGIRKMLGAHTGAPDDYDLNLGEGYEDYEVNPDDLLLKDFTAYAKESKMSQEGFTKGVRMFTEYSKYQNERETKELQDFQKVELAKIAETPQAADAAIKEMCQWFKQNFPEGDEQDLKDMMFFGNAFQLVKGFRSKMGYAKVPVGSSSGESGLPPDQLSKMVADERYVKDPRYQKMVDTEYAKVYGK